jgi:hypothetical protein
MSGEEYGYVQHPLACRLKVISLRIVPAAARPCRAGALSAEPGGGRASGAAQRRRA